MNMLQLSSFSLGNPRGNASKNYIEEKTSTKWLD